MLSKNIRPNVYKGKNSKVNTDCFFIFIFFFMNKIMYNFY